MNFNFEVDVSKLENLIRDAMNASREVSEDPLEELKKNNNKLATMFFVRRCIVENINEGVVRVIELKDDKGG